MASKFRRKQFIVEKGLQFRFTRFVTFFVFLSCIATALVIFYSTFMILGGKLADVYPQARLVAIFKSVYLAFFGCMVILLPIIFWGSILFSHRIAGPLPKIYRALKDIAKGSFDVHLVLRERDELKDQADAINEMARELKERELKK